MKRLAVFCLGGVCSAMLLLLIVHMYNSEGPRPEQITRKIAKDRFTKSRAFDATAGRKAEIRNLGPLHRGGDLAGLYPAIPTDLAVNPYEELQNGDERWAATVLHLSDFAYLRDERLACAENHAMDLISHCRGSIEMVFDVSSIEAMGKVLSAQSSAEPDAPEDGEACSAYVECLAQSRIGSVVPLPVDLLGGGTVAIALDTVYTWASPAMFDPAKVAELIVSREGDLEQGLNAGRVSDFEKNSEERLIDYLRQHMDRLNGSLSEGSQ